MTHAGLVSSGSNGFIPSFSGRGCGMGLLHRNWRRSSPTWVASQLPGPHTPASAGCTESAGGLGQMRVSPRPNTEHPRVKHPSWPWASAALGVPGPENVNGLTFSTLAY